MSDPQSIPGYTLLRPVGRGNTSQVYLASDPDGQRVALKLPHDSTLQHQEAAERFGNEVRLTLQLRHPHLVRGYAGMPFGTQAFLSMRYYPGGALDEQLGDLPERRLPTMEAARILTDVASALVYLHEAGAVHQDVKPQNVYVDGGRAALGDLGSTYFTSQGGKVSGSPYYMAPEIYHGESSSSASDVYSLGIMMYELLTGARPFQGSTYEELMVSHLTRFPQPLSHLNPEIPRSVARLAEQALAKRAADRPAAATLHQALQAFIGETPPEPEGLTPVAPSKAMGRHAPAPPRTPENAKGPAAPEGRSWNPFKRRK